MNVKNTTIARSFEIKSVDDRVELLFYVIGANIGSCELSIVNF